MPCRIEKIDGSGLLPIRAADRAFPTAYAFRRFLQRTLRDHLLDAPKANPLARLKLPRLDSLPTTLTRRWPAASKKLLSRDPAVFACLPIDHGVLPRQYRRRICGRARPMQEFSNKKIGFVY